MKLKKAIVIGLASLGASSAIAQQTVFDIIENSANHTILEQALNKAGLNTVLDDPNGNYTVFAPDDNAFTDFLTANNLSAQEILDNPDLSNILLHHVLDGTVLSTSLSNSEVVTKAPSGADVTVDISTYLNEV